jgi:hypothetical protein
MKILHSKGAYEGKKRVMIAVPSYNSIAPESLYSLFGAKEALLRNNIESELLIVTENCHIDDGRNFCVRNFLEGECVDLIFIDADIRFDPEDIVRLAMYSPDVVAGIYPKKQEDVEFPIRWLPVKEIWSNKEGLIEVESVPTGFLKISRQAFEKIDATVPHYLAQKDIFTRRKIPLIFERTLREQTRLGGDYEFCRKWRELGGKIFIDPEMTFGHVGNFEWTGNLGVWLRKKNGLTANHVVSLIDRVRSHTDTPRDISSLWESWGNEWTPPAEMLSVINMMVRDGFGPILECGSGLTTLLMGASGRPITSLEHDKKWYESIKQYLKLCELDNVELISATLKGGWYGVDLTTKYSLVLVDGPPRGVGDRSLVVEHVNVTDECVFIVDDVGTDLDICGKISSKFGVKFNYFGRYAIGVRK